MTYFKIGLSLAFFVPVFVLFGLSGWHDDWYGGFVGGMIGVFFGQVNGPWLDVFYPPGDGKPDERKRADADDAQ